jgi:hypothetical protein
MATETYLAILATMLFADALLCHAMKRRFNLLFAIPCALAWPFTLPVMILGCAYLTRNYPNPWDTPNAGEGGKR